MASTNVNVVIIIIFAAAGCITQTVPESDTPVHKDFIKQSGCNLVVGDEQVHLRGINFNNYHWEKDPLLIVGSDHHSEIDFQRVAHMGMNVIRFNLSYVIFEDDDNPYVYKQTAWDWLDQNIRWAKKYGLYLIFDMHVPQGGYQGGTNEGCALWENKENQKRLKSLWRTIAERYKNESTIAAWDLINEPTPPDQHQWKVLAQELIDEIRSVDQNHLIIVEIAYIDDYSLFCVEDENVMYDFHFYHPFEYTHQYSYYVGRGDGGVYPDPDVSVLPSEFVWADEIENPKVLPGDSDWQFYQGHRYKVENPQIVSGTPTCACGINGGTVYFDDFVVREYNEDNTVVREIRVDIEYVEEWWTLTDVNPFVSLPEWWIPWSSDGGGTHTIAEKGYAGNYSLSISNVTSQYTVSNPGLSIAVKQGYSYQISGWLKGENVTGESCYITLEFGLIPPGEKFEPVTKDNLEKHILYGVAFSLYNNVPLNVGEFGLTRYCFDKGGLIWVQDMLNLFDKHNINFQYYDYHSEIFGVYQNKGLPSPDFANQGLIDLFKTFFSHQNVLVI